MLRLGLLPELRNGPIGSLVLMKRLGGHLIVDLGVAALGVGAFGE